MKIYLAEQQKSASVAIGAIDGYSYHDFQFTPPDTYRQDESPSRPAWLWKFVDVNQIQDSNAVGLNSKPVTDETIRKVVQLRQLQQLDMASTPEVAEFGLEMLESLDDLTYLRLDGALVTPAMIDDYQKRHPAVEVVR